MFSMGPVWEAMKTPGFGDLPPRSVTLGTHHTVPFLAWGVGGQRFQVQKQESDMIITPSWIVCCIPYFRGLLCIVSCNS